VRVWWQIIGNRAMQDADPVNPQRVFWELSSRLPDDCILTADSGSVANWFRARPQATPTFRRFLPT
jgi:pyruvate dehydrogenase (quinone)